MGLPVVVSDFPLYRGVVAENSCGILVDPDDVSMVEDALVYLIDCPDKAKVMGERGQDLVRKQYEWSREFIKLSQFYKDLLMKKNK